MALNKEERLEKLLDIPTDSLFIIERDGCGGRYWKADDHGYTDDIRQAKLFTHEEMVNKITDNFFIDKDILVFRLNELKEKL